MNAIGTRDIFEQQPLRTFVVCRPATLAVLSPPQTTLKAHIASMTDNGGLVFATLKAGLAFTTHVFAPGQWASYEGTIPTDDDVRAIKSFADRENAINEMLLSAGKATQM